MLMRVDQPPPGLSVQAYERGNISFSGYNPVSTAQSHCHVLNTHNQSFVESRIPLHFYLQNLLFRPWGGGDCTGKLHHHQTDGRRVAGVRTISTMQYNVSQNFNDVPFQHANCQALDWRAAAVETEH
eukprot:EG_transcript_37875